MSFHLNNSHTQPKQTHVSGDDVSHDHGVLNSRVIPITLDLFQAKQSPPRLEFLDDFSKSKQKRSLDDHNFEATMNRKNGNNNNVLKLDLKLNLSTPSSRLRNPRAESPSRSASVSPPSSCVSSELSSPEASSMVLVGCPRCLMYVMLSEDDPRCPKCKSTVLLDFLHDNNNNNANNNANNGSNCGSSKKTRKG